jgi:DNA-binding GntR family transcriptional regulator
LIQGGLQIFFIIDNTSTLYTMLQKSTAHSKANPKSVPVREWTYNHLKSDVLAGHFKPGERLTEAHLAKTLGVSRTPVRETLHKLASEGLIQPLESRGFCVARDSREEIEDLFDIRSALEGYAIRLICDCISEQTLEQLNGFIRKAQDALDRKMLDEIFEYNTQFHDALHQVIAHKTRFHSLIADTRKYVLRYRKDSLFYLDGAKRTIDGHRKILLAIGLRDPDLCERIIREHIREAKQDALHKIAEDIRTS